MSTAQAQVDPRPVHAFPVPARPRVDAAAVKVPDGYVVEPVMMGLSYPNGLAFGSDGTLYISEAGNTIKRRPFLGARVLALTPDGNFHVLLEEREAIMGLDVDRDHLYLSLDGAPSKIVRYNLGTWSRKVIVENPAAGGNHPVNGPRLGPDGLLYFGQGASSINGVMGLNQYRNGSWRRNPRAHEVPGQDVTLHGHNYEAPDPRKPLPMPAMTGAYKPFGTPSEPGEVVQGRTLCTTSVLRSHPDGTGVELVAWGIREGFGFDWDDRGELYVGDNNMSDAGTRPVANDPDRIWHVEGARQPHGNVTTPAWYGYPDICADGKPVTAPDHAPESAPPEETKRLIQDPPEYAGPAPIQLKPHVGVAGMAFSPGGAFGHGGSLFVALIGSFAPATTPREGMGANGFQVARVNTRTGRATNFLSNHEHGPAHNEGPHGGGSPEGEGRRQGGIERPVDVAFDPEGDHMYVLDVGRIDTTKHGVSPWARTGILWRVSPTEVT